MHMTALACSTSCSRPLACATDPSAVLATCSSAAANQLYKMACACAASFLSTHCKLDGTAQRSAFCACHVLLGCCKSALQNGLRLRGLLFVDQDLNALNTTLNATLNATQCSMLIYANQAPQFVHPPSALPFPPAQPSTSSCSAARFSAVRHPTANHSSPIPPGPRFIFQPFALSHLQPPHSPAPSPLPLPILGRCRLLRHEGGGDARRRAKLIRVTLQAPTTPPTPLPPNNQPCPLKTCTNCAFCFLLTSNIL